MSDREGTSLRARLGYDRGVRHVYHVVERSVPHTLIVLKLRLENVGLLLALVVAHPEHVWRLRRSEKFWTGGYCWSGNRRQGCGWG